MKIIFGGNILNVSQGIICHQTNCKGVMGSGLALSIKKQYPKAYSDYMDRFATFGLQLGDVVMSKQLSGLYVANLCGQNEYGRKLNKVYTNYESLKVCFQQVSDFAKMKHTIYIPYGIGCGLAGGDWNKVESMLESILENNKAIIIKL